MDRSCPLGHTCEACLWQVKTTRQHIHTGEVDVIHQCALVALVEQSSEQAKQIYSLGAAVESQRNETVQAAQRLAGALSTGLLENRRDA